MSNMEAKLLEYRARKRKEALLKTAKETIKNLLHLNATQEGDNQTNVQLQEEVVPLVPNTDETIERAASPAVSSDNESEDIGSDNNSLYLRFSRTSLVVMSFVLWAVVFLIFIQIEFGIIYLIVSALVGIYFNTRTALKKENEISAYSVFNKNCQSIDGTLKAEDMEKAMLYGPLALR